MEKKIYSNPRMTAEIPNWPIGGNRRGLAIFSIERRGNNERGVRTTSDNGRFYKPKKLTYSEKARIVDGSDGRTYIAELTPYGFISIMRGDMKIEEETIHTDDSRYEETKRLFDV